MATTFLTSLQAKDKSSDYKNDNYSPFLDEELKDVLQQLLQTRMEHHERRGYNAKNYTKVIVYKTLKRMDDWIETNRNSEGQDLLH